MRAEDAPRDLPDGYAWGEVPSPVGPLVVAVSPLGLLRLGFAGTPPPFAGPRGLDAHPLGAQIVRELSQYFAGARRGFDTPLDWSLTAGAQRDILRTLHERVGYGQSVGYGQLARLSGRTVGASRLVGTVMGSNPIAIVVPCHRVVAADGGLGGFGGGRERKHALLTLEGALQPALF